MSSNITINGKQYAGDRLNIINGKVLIDGEIVTINDKTINIVVNGDVLGLEVDVANDIEITGNVGNLKSGSGDVKCSTVAGNVQTGSGDVTSSVIYGNVNTGSGDVLCNQITGPIKTGSGKVVNIGPGHRVIPDVKLEETQINYGAMGKSGSYGTAGSAMINNPSPISNEPSSIIKEYEFNTQRREDTTQDDGTTPIKHFK